MTIQGVILAAGKGTRLQPVTPTRSKAMAPVAGKPIVARVFDLFVQNGIHDILLLISPDDPDIRAYFDDYLQRGRNGRPTAVQRSDEVTVKFVVQEERLGMAHALTLLAPYLHGDFLMSACDNLVPPKHIAALIETQKSYGANAVLSLMEIDIAKSASTGIVAFQAGGQWIERIVEKPQPAEAPSNISSLPLYYFTHKLLDYLPLVRPSTRGEYELQDAIQMMIDDAGRVMGALTPDRWQLTNVADLLALNRHYLAVEGAGNSIGPESIGPELIGNKTQIEQPVYIDSGTQIGARCTIGPNVTIEADCHIGDDCLLQNCILLKGASLPAGSEVIDKVVM